MVTIHGKFQKHLELLVVSFDNMFLLCAMVGNEIMSEIWELFNIFKLHSHVHC